MRLLLIFGILFECSYLYASCLQKIDPSGVQVEDSGKQIVENCHEVDSLEEYLDRREVILKEGLYTCNSDLISKIQVSKNKEIKYMAKGNGVRGVELIVNGATSGYIDDLSALRFFRGEVEVRGKYEKRHKSYLFEQEARLEAFSSEGVVLTPQKSVQFIAVRETEIDASLPYGIASNSLNEFGYLFDSNEMVEVKCKL